MKKVHLLSGMIVLGAVAGINARSNNQQVNKLVRQINAETKKLNNLTAKAQVSNWPAVFNILSSNKINVNEYLSPDGYTLLDIAVETNNVSATETLLKKYNANPNIGPDTAFMIACEKSSTDTNKYDPHHVTHPHKYGPIFILLLKHGANTDQNLQYAMDNGYPEAVEAIGKYRNDPKILNGYVPLTASRRYSSGTGLGTGSFPSWIPGNK